MWLVGVYYSGLDKPIDGHYLILSYPSENDYDFESDFRRIIDTLRIISRE